MAAGDITDGTSNTTLVGEGEQAGEAPPPLTGTRPRDDQAPDVDPGASHNVARCDIRDDLYVETLQLSDRR